MKAGGTADAIQGLDAAQAALTRSQYRMSTGKKIASARDDGSGYMISRHIETQIAEQQVLRQNQLRGASLLDVTQSSVSSIGDTLSQLREKALALTDDSLSPEDHTALRSDMDALTRQLDQSAKSATFNGINLLAPPQSNSTTWGRPYAGIIGLGNSYTPYNVGTAAGRFDLALNLVDVTSASIFVNWGDGTNTASTAAYSDPYSKSTVISHNYDDSASNRVVSFSISASGPNVPSGFHIPYLSFTPAPPDTRIQAFAGGGTLNLAHEDMTSAGLGLGQVSSVDGADALAAVDNAISLAEGAATYYGSRQNDMDRLITHTGRLIDTYTAAHGKLVDADMTQEAATFQAVQTRMSLASQSLSIANQAARVLLSLFKN